MRPSVTTGFWARIHITAPNGTNAGSIAIERLGVSAPSFPLAPLGLSLNHTKCGFLPQYTFSSDGCSVKYLRAFGLPGSVDTGGGPGGIVASAVRLPRTDGV